MTNLKLADPSAIVDEDRYVSVAGVLSELQRRHSKYDTLKGVEIGTCRGVSAAALCEAFPQLTLYTVDPYAPYQDWREFYDTDYQLEVARMAYARLDPYMASGRCFHVLAESEIARHDLATAAPFDFAFIDGAHDYENVKRDLAAWWDAMKPGALFAGHDFGSIAGVTQAVQEWAALQGRQVHAVENNGWWMER